MKSMRYKLFSKILSPTLPFRLKEFIPMTRKGPAVTMMQAERGCATEQNRNEPAADPAGRLVPRGGPRRDEVM